MIFHRDVCRKTKSLIGLVLLFTASVVMLCYASARTGAPGPPGRWVTLKKCHFQASDFNDGDSFHVRYEGQEFIVRLYFVDAPEVDDSFPERNREQCRHFGVTGDQNRKAGLEAGKVTAALLRKPFTITTRSQDAMGRSKLPRYYAVVTVGGKDLAEVLVSRGLARVKGASASLPDGVPGKEHMTRLKKIEAEARAKRLGLWEDSKKDQKQGWLRKLFN
jgi:endonuclease YncB( thermonuclease family)